MSGWSHSKAVITWLAKLSSCGPMLLAGDSCSETPRRYLAPEWCRTRAVTKLGSERQSRGVAQPAGPLGVREVIKTRCAFWRIDAT